ncbi:DsbA family protein [Alteromonas stellipolaris]|jgi:putative protein-disulfide isomerase|uniref:DsbA family protein n=1 Tax=Alteromonas stellipolaris TaxID=233316 RepID=UPI0027341529|nr:DsbA family protein [Alteromonas stellipolaris]MDP2537008.1 DsbA family protein [Alteromonas stellipolaris]
MVTVHYFFDPMCGWCYGATPLAEILQVAPNINLVLHAGGMIHRREMDDDFRTMAQGFDKKIALQTGQLFSKEYRDRLSSNKTIILDSYITAQAVSVMEQLCGRGFDMLKAIQKAHYQLAIDVSDQRILTSIADQLGISQSEWLNLMRLKGVHIVDDIQQSQQLMKQWGVSGFPTFIIEKEGSLAILSHENYYQAHNQFKALINQL